MTDTKGKIFTIPPSDSFSDCFTLGLLEETKGNEASLPNYLILLPTRRACRVIRDSFLRQTKGKPLLLPRLQPVGDIDEEELLINYRGSDALNIPPAISAIQRQAYLARIITKLPDFSKSPAHDLALANALGQLLDQIYTEDLNINELPDLVDREKFAQHWQVTLDFLQIISEHWPNILSEKGVIDAADRRNRLIQKLTQHWQESPPDYPVIAAGTTGSIPATATLLKTIMSLPQGRVVLPGLDKTSPDDVWNNIDETHPQGTLKNLMSALDINRKSVEAWPCSDSQTSSVENFVYDALVPAENTDAWQNTKSDSNLTEELSHISLYECNTPQEEASLISLIMRDALEDKEKITALVTPDRDLARRTAQACQRWNIALDDSAGTRLSQTTAGSYILSVVETCQQGLSPVSLLSFLKHKLNTGANFENFRQVVRHFDKQVLRGLKPQSGLDGLRKKYNDIKSDQYSDNLDSEILNLIDHIEPLLTELLSLFDNGQYHSFKTFIKTHLHALENFTPDHILWSGENGETAAQFFSEILEEAHHFPDVNGSDYISIIKQLMDQKTVRPKYGTHPRLMILGQLESRLIHADRVILSGLNEGTWPSENSHDPWMSRPMRQDFGLPPSERGIGLSAHDFVHGFCKKEVFLTRSKRVDGSPTVPSRWLQRINTYLQAHGLSDAILRKEKFSAYQNYLDEVIDQKPFSRPAPTPASEHRPEHLSVTAIDTWLKDPYSIYAKHILKLKALEPLEKEWSAIEKGNLLHAILERFNKKFPDQIPKEAYDQFIEIARDEFNKNGDEDLTEFWLPKIQKIGSWYTEYERSWRSYAKPIVHEEKGSVQISIPDHQFTLSGRADRIDQTDGNSCIIIDYKSGGSFSAKGIMSGQYPQLPLEAYILEQNGFTGLSEQACDGLNYLLLTGANPAGKVVALKNDKQNVDKAIASAEEGIRNLVSIFFDKDTPYYSIPNLDNAPRFNDYEHLARVKEWAALGETGETGEAA